MIKKLSAIAAILLGSVAIFLSFYFKIFLSTWWVAVLIVGILVLIVGLYQFKTYFFKKSTTDEKEKPQYRRKKTIMSRQEMEFYEILKSLFAEKYLILPQMPLIGVIDKLTQTSYRNELFRVVDFCLVEPNTYAPLILIELNDSSHKRADRIERDRKVTEICEAASMPLVTFTSVDYRDVPTVRKTIIKNILKK